MQISMSLINQKSTLLPGAEYSFPAEEHSFIVIQSYGSLQVVKHHMKTSINNNEMLLIKSGNKRIRLFNHNEVPVSYRSILFSVKNVYWPYKKMILSGGDVNTISQVFDNLDEGIFINCMKDIFSSECHMELSEVSRKNEGKIDSRLIKINRYIRNNYNKQISLSDLSDIIKCSPTYLSNTYKKIFDISPIYYLNKIRICKAAELLMNSSLTIKEISESVGYGSSAQFCLIFKRYMDVTPTNFRRKGS